MEQLTIQSLGFLVGFREDIKIIIIVIVIVIVIIIIIIIIIIVIIIVILAFPDARCESRQTSGSCRDMFDILRVFIYIYIHTHIVCMYMYIIHTI